MSAFDGRGDVFLADCPARLAVEPIAELTRWAQDNGAAVVDALDRIDAGRPAAAVHGVAE